MIPSTNMLSPTSGCSFTAIMFSWDQNVNAMTLWVFTPQKLTSRDELHPSICESRRRVGLFRSPISTAKLLSPQLICDCCCIGCLLVWLNVYQPLKRDRHAPSAVFVCRSTLQPQPHDQAACSTSISPERFNIVLLTSWDLAKKMIAI